MKRIFLTTLVLGSLLAAHAQAPVEWNREAYPDYNPTPTFDYKWLNRAKAHIKARKAKGETRPDHWNNADTDAFPPVVNQSAGSCGSASRIYYMFTHEINAARHANGKLAENIYPTHFTWLLTWVSSQGKEILAQHTGIPNSVVYGGKTYSETFGYQDCDDGQSNYGWMQGYDKWFHAMHNRLANSANFPAVNTEEGRELLKNYLWNHCGDESYSAGGVVGIGVASGGNWQKIGSTATNKELGVVGKYYVKKWGNSVDHALTIVGYDDRIEFDLDGNGKYGETDKDEVGAWIVVNSWGDWCNNGFIYCPYAEARPTATTTGYWTPEYYTIRRNYRPLRTLKVTMDYNRRSEMALYVGVSQNLDATKPDKSMWLRHFYYAGLGKGAKTNPDPEIPMLGKWADGELHSEPMEFGYDLTDLTSDMDLDRPIKYFFWVETRNYAQGEGHIYNASIIDYTLDKEGIETPFDLTDGGVAIANAGKKTEISAVARHEVMGSPRNLALAGQQLSWQAPTRANMQVSAYHIYKNGILALTVDGNTYSATVDGEGAYTVTAVSGQGDEAIESNPSAAVIGRGEAEPLTNQVLQLNSSFTVPNATQGSVSAYTLEFWMRPNSFPSQDAYGIKASAGKFFFKVTKDRRLIVGHDGGDCLAEASAPTLSTNTWYHVAVVISDLNIKVYLNGSMRVNWTSGWNNSGIAGTNNFIFGKTEGTTYSNKQVYDAPWSGYLDEIRMWNRALTQAEIKANYKDAFIYPQTQADLLHYYRMDVVGQADAERENLINNVTELIDAQGRGNIAIDEPEKVKAWQFESGNRYNPLSFNPSADFTLSATTLSVGQALTLADNSSPSTVAWNWTFTGADVATAGTSNPVVVFTQAGTQTVKLVTTNANGETAEKEATVTVQAATAPKASFKMSVERTAAGEHVTFINTSTPLDACTYEWTLKGADNECVRTTNAGATYQAKGTYKVKLTATNAAGTSTAEDWITVETVAPVADFAIHNNVCVKGEKIYLVDASKYEPTQWQWSIASQNSTLAMNGQNGSITLDEPGTYNVSLKATNEAGTGTATRTRAITVCNADGQTGLKFGGTNELSEGQTGNNTVTAPAPLASRSSFTIEWWMYPNALEDYCIPIGDSEATFLLKVAADGTMNVTVKKKTAASASGFVVQGEWHHYAVVYRSGSVTFYRDCEQVSTATTGVSTCPAWTQFRIGGDDAAMNAIIDELRVWSTNLSLNGLKSVANGPTEPASTLALYYDFNQTSGDVIDRSGHDRTGVRTNFGPDGDAWTTSTGIFCLNFDHNVTAVTSKYLKNYQAAFATTSGFVNGTSRFKKLATGTTTSPWIQENEVTEGSVTTCWHVDANKGSYLTLSTKWDGFADGVKNLKLYQTVTLPAGAYELSVSTDKEAGGYGSCFLVAAPGRGLPDYADLSTQAFGFANLNNKLNFVLNEETEVSLGILSNQTGQTCTTIKAFALTTKPFRLVDANGESVADGIEALPGIAAPATDQLFDLSGRRVATPGRGIYIRGGRKVVVR